MGPEISSLPSARAPKNSAAWPGSATVARRQGPSPSALVEDNTYSPSKKPDHIPKIRHCMCHNPTRSILSPLLTAATLTPPPPPRELTTSSPTSPPSSPALPTSPTSLSTFARTWPLAHAPARNAPPSPALRSDGLRQGARRRIRVSLTSGAKRQMKAYLSSLSSRARKRGATVPE